MVSLTFLAALSPLCSFSACGVTRIIFGILLVCRWSRWYALGFLVFAETHQNGRMRPGVSEEVRGPISTLRTRCRELINSQLGCGVRYAPNNDRFLRRSEMTRCDNRGQCTAAKCIFIRSPRRRVRAASAAR